MVVGRLQANTMSWKNKTQESLTWVFKLVLSFTFCCLSGMTQNLQKQRRESFPWRLNCVNTQQLQMMRSLKSHIHRMMDSLDFQNSVKQIHHHWCMGDSIVDILLVLWFYCFIVSRRFYLVYRTSARQKQNGNHPAIKNRTWVSWDRANRKTLKYIVSVWSYYPQFLVVLRWAKCASIVLCWCLSMFNLILSCFLYSAMVLSQSGWLASWSWRQKEVRSKGSLQYICHSSGTVLLIARHSWFALGTVTWKLVVIFKRLSNSLLYMWLLPPNVQTDVRRYR